MFVHVYWPSTIFFIAGMLRAFKCNQESWKDISGFLDLDALVSTGNYRGQIYYRSFIKLREVIIPACAFETRASVVCCSFCFCRFRCHFNDELLIKIWSMILLRFRLLDWKNPKSVYYIICFSILKPTFSYDDDERLFVNIGPALC